MKKFFLLLVMHLLVAAAFVFMTACDDSSSSSSDCEPGTWKVVTPKNGSTFEDCKGAFVLQYCGTLGAFTGTEQIYFPSESETFNDSNSAITIDGSTVTIDIDDAYSLDSNNIYEEITISGFTDSDLNPIDSFTTTGYSFTSCDK